MGRPDIGVDRNVENAMHYFEMAAERGNLAQAEFNTGVFYLNDLAGKNEFDRFNKSLKYFNKCAAKNMSQCYNALAHMYYNGIGVEKNRTSGMELF